MTLRINCWSGPRNISTALMYSFRQRTDTTVVDEPIYAHYLEVSGRNHPGRNAVLAGQDSNGARVVEEVILGHYETPVVFFKQMCHHLVGLDRSFLGSCHNILLIREPRQVLRSHSVNLPDVKVTDIGLDVQVDLLETILANGDRPLVVDSAVLLRDPGACWPRSARDSACRLRRQCCPGRLGLTPRTEYGPGTGTRMPTGRSDSRPVFRGPGRCPIASRLS